MNLCITYRTETLHSFLCSQTRSSHNVECLANTWNNKTHNILSPSCSVRLTVSGFGLVGSWKGRLDNKEKSSKLERKWHSDVCMHSRAFPWTTSSVIDKPVGIFNILGLSVTRLKIHSMQLRIPFNGWLNHKINETQHCSASNENSLALICENRKLKNRCIY